MKIRFIAKTLKEQQAGLSNQKPLALDECAWFYFAVPGNYRFYNKDVSFPIAVIFCDADGRVGAIEYMQANQLEVVSPLNPYQSVVECHPDAILKCRIRIGDKLEIIDNDLHFI